MTTEILNITEDAPMTDADILAINPADWVLVDTNQSADDTVREAVYQFVGGDPQYPAQVRVGHYRPKKNGPTTTTNISVKFSTYVKKTDTEGVIEWVLPASFTLASSMPGGLAIPDVTDYLVGIQNLLSWLAPAAAAGVLTSTNVDKLKFGIPNVL